MSFQEEFNASGAADSGLYSVRFDKLDSGVSLSLYQSGHYSYFHFVTRTMSVHSSHGLAVVPFSQLDREVLEFMHAKLVEMGGRPPALPAADSGKRELIQKAP